METLSVLSLHRDNSNDFRYLPGSPSGLVEVQKLFVGDALSLDWLPSPDARTVQLFVHTGGRKLKTYLFKGASGFVEEDSVHIDGKSKFNIFLPHFSTFLP